MRVLHGRSLIISQTTRLAPSAWKIVVQLIRLIALLLFHESVPCNTSNFPEVESTDAHSICLSTTWTNSKHLKLICADCTPSRKERIEENFRSGHPLLDLPPEAWLGYMAPILRGSHAMTCSKLSGSVQNFHLPFTQRRPSRPLLIRIVVQHVMPPHLAAHQHVALAAVD